MKKTKTMKNWQMVRHKKNLKILNHWNQKLKIAKKKTLHNKINLKKKTKRMLR